LSDVFIRGFKEAHELIAELLASPEQLQSFEVMAKICIETLEAGGNIFTCGNGGSHCDAMHFAEELTGRYRKNRRPLGALALGDPSHITCVSNDYGFESIFSRQVEALGRKGDLLIGISTSGNSKNVINGAEKAKSLGLKTIGLLGKGGGELAEVVDHCVIVPGETTDRIQEFHIKVIHLTIEAIERKLFPENY